MNLMKARKNKDLDWTLPQYSMINHTIKYESSKDAEVSPDLSMYFITEGIKSHRATEHHKKK